MNIPFLIDIEGRRARVVWLCLFIDERGVHEGYAIVECDIADLIQILTSF